jgi:hypothetical protein
MVDQERAEANAANLHRTPQRHCASLSDREATKRCPRGRGRIDRTWGAVDKACRVVGVRMREDDRSRRNGWQMIPPIRAAVDHNAGIVLLHK